MGLSCLSIMGASNSTSVIKNGDWEHRLCWTEPPTPASTPTKDNSPNEDTANMENGQNNNYFSVKRNSSLTKSLRLLSKRTSPQRGSWQKLKPQHSYEETKNGIEMASMSSSVGTTKTEEFVI